LNLGMIPYIIYSAKNSFLCHGLIVKYWGDRIKFMDFADVVDKHLQIRQNFNLTSFVFLITCKKHIICELFIGIRYLESWTFNRFFCTQNGVSVLMNSS